MNCVSSFLILALLVHFIRAKTTTPPTSTSIPPDTTTPEDLGPFRFTTNTQILIIVCCFIAAFALVAMVAVTICIVRRVLKSRPRKSKGFRQEPRPTETPKVSQSNETTKASVTCERQSRSISGDTPKVSPKRSPTYEEMLNETPPSEMSPPTEWIESQ